MKMKLCFRALLFIFCLFTFCPVISKVPDGEPVDVNVFLDTHGIDMNHLRQEIKHVNYTRTSESANVHLLSTTQNTGGHGQKYIFYFIGKREFEGLSDTLYYFSSPDKTGSEIRDDYTNIIRLGLARYLAHGSQVVDVEFNGEKQTSITSDEGNWDHWVFEINTDTRIDGEETEREFDLNLALDVERITPQWRIEFDLDNNYEEEWYKADGEEIVATRTGRNLQNLVVKSVGDHMAVGLKSGVASSSYNNIKLRYWASPAVEYNLFPYELSSRKQLRFSYFIGYDGREYMDTTIYNQISEDLVRQTFAIAYKVKEKWGSAYTSISAKNYFHDFNKNSFSIYSGLYLRVWKGLSLNVSGNYAIINDRLSLLKSEASIEEILLKQVQQATTYRYQLRLGLSFTFGSLYNNVVNPRLKG